MPPEVEGIERVLRAFPNLAIQPSESGDTVLEGWIDFRYTNATDSSEICDRYRVRITFPRGYPNDFPVVEEIGGKLPREANFHVYGDGSLCLENPLRIRLHLRDSPDPLRFIEYFVVPFLHGMTEKLRGRTLPHGELAHGEDGLLADGEQIFGLHAPSAVRQAYYLLSMRRRHANRQRCPCGCGRALRGCRFRFILNGIRDRVGRAWARAYHLRYLQTQ